MTVIIKQMKIQITPQHRHSVAINKYYRLVQEVQSNPHALIKKVIILFILLNMSYLSTKERPAGFCILVTNQHDGVVFTYNCHSIYTKM